MLWSETLTQLGEWCVRNVKVDDSYQPCQTAI